MKTNHHIDAQIYGKKGCDDICTEWMTCDMEFEIFFYLHEQQQQNLTHLFSSKKPIFFPEKTSYFEFQVRQD